MKKWMIVKNCVPAVLVMAALTGCAGRESNLLKNKGATQTPQESKSQNALDAHEKLVPDLNAEKEQEYRRVLSEREAQAAERLDKCTRELRVNPKNVVALMEHASFFSSDLRTCQKAIDDYDRVVALDPKNEEAYSLRAAAYAWLEQYRKAIDDYTKAIAFDSKNPEYFRSRADAYGHAGLNDKAIADYTKAIRLDPEDQAQYKARADEHRLLQQHQLAIDDYTKAIKLDSTDGESYRGRAHESYALKHLQAAIDDYGRAIDAGVCSYQDCYSFRADIYDEMGQHQKAAIDRKFVADSVAADNDQAAEHLGGAGSAAQASTDEATSANPSSKEDPEQVRTDELNMLSSRAFDYREAGQYRKAIDDYSRLIVLEPTASVNYTNRACAFQSCGDHEKAIQDFNRAIQLAPNESENYQKRGDSYTETKGERQKGIDDYNKSIAVCTRAIATDLGYLRPFEERGLAYLSLQKYELAMKDYNEALRIFPNYHDAFFGRGKVYFALGQNSKAIEDFTKAINAYASDKSVYLARAKAYEALGQHDKASEDLKTAAHPPASKPLVVRAKVSG